MTPKNNPYDYVPGSIQNSTFDSIFWSTIGSHQNTLWQIESEKNKKTSQELWEVLNEIIIKDNKKKEEENNENQ